MTMNIESSKRCPNCGLNYGSPYAACPVCVPPAAPPAGESSAPASRSLPPLHLQYLHRTAVKELVKKLGKRCGDDFLAALDDLVRSRIVAASKVHNGGRKTLDAACLGVVSRR